jgi:K+ transporter
MSDRVSFNTRGPKFCKIDSHEEFPSVLSVTGTFGFREKQDVFPVLDAAYQEMGINPNPLEVTYFLSRETIVRATTGFSLNAVQEKLFEVLNRNRRRRTLTFHPAAWSSWACRSSSEACAQRGDSTLKTNACLHG